MTELTSLTPRRLKIVLLAAPMLLALLYYGLIAADRYVSESTVALQQSGNDASAVPGAALLLAVTACGSAVVRLRLSRVSASSAAVTA